MKLHESAVFDNPEAAIKKLLQMFQTHADEPEGLLALQEMGAVLNAYKAPKKLVLSENFMVKAEAFIDDDANKQKLMSTCRKIGFRYEESYCIAIGGDIFLLQVRTDRVFYAAYTSDILFLLGTAHFAPEVGDVPFAITVHYANNEADKKAFAGVTNEELGYNASIGLLFTFVFIYFVEIKTIEVAPKAKYKPEKFEAVKNLTKRPFTVVDVSWDTAKVSTIGFAVKGHYRLQPYGEGRQKVKLIFIEAFMKEGYSRKSGKELFEEK